MEATASLPRSQQPPRATALPALLRSALAVLSCALAVALAAPPALAGTANAGIPGAPRSNPIAGMPWGVYTGPIDNVYPAYAAASGRNKRLLAKIALQPKAFWFGAWYSDGYARTVAEQYIGNVQAGDPNTLAMVSVFRLDPWEGAACSTVLGPGAQASYRAWVDNFAAGIGSARVALILQPDLPFANCAPNRTPLDLVAYAARRFTALPHTTVYIDAGAAAWLPVPTMTRLLVAAGIRHVRGFALNATQYGSTGLELAYGGQIVRALAAQGIHGKHFVVNTSENGAPFLAGQYPGNTDNARVCLSRFDTICTTLGIPPTWDVANPRWGLSGHERSIAARYADAYLWIGRPWMDNNAFPFDLSRALGLASSTPF